MCGIAGWIDQNRDLRAQTEIVERMGATLASRGPDDAGTWISSRAALAHRRLIVIDPRGGAQPMVRRRGEHEFVITYNGELYNTDELRQELIACGQVFSSRSDTEVLLRSYMQWGKDCLEKLNGIFAFAVWDDCNKTLFMARDRLGVKPLFYRHLEGSFLFASELKALLANPLVEPRLDAEGLAEVLIMGPARTPGHGVFKGVQELKPGCWLVYQGQKVKTGSYWSLQSHPHDDDLEETTARVRGLFFDTVKRQLVSDVPVCTFLSGGVDSSAISAVAAAEFRRKGAAPLNTFEVDFEGNDRFFRPSRFQPNNDGPWAKKMSGFIGSHHHRIEITTRDLVASLDDALRARDLPGMADVDSSLLLFCRQIKHQATVALSGESADEIFGGYPWFYQEDAPSNTFPWARQISRRAQLFQPEIRQLLRAEEYMARRYREALAEVPRLPGESPQEARRRELFYLNITRFMPTLLDRKDRMSMAAGLEVRVPFCDHRLAQYVWNIPWEMKTWEGREKGIFRRALRGLLPDAVLFRKKSPYPKTHNPAYYQAVKQRLEEELTGGTAPLKQIVDQDSLQDLLAAGPDNPLPWFGQLMTVPQVLAYLVQLNTWLREYKVSF